MLRQFNNYIQSIQTYQDLSPDIQIRQQVNQRLRSQRAPLAVKAWCREFYRATRANQTLLAFVFTYFPAYSGLEFSLVRPQDRLIEDLQFPLVCWFDWSNTFCDDFMRQFGVDISEQFDETCFDTLADLLRFLEDQLQLARN